MDPGARRAARALPRRSGAAGAVADLDARSSRRSRCGGPSIRSRLRYRTLDALHLAAVDYLLAQRLRVTLATLDERMRRAATALSIELEPSLDA